ncbi:MAG: retropepsin-like aspartic protease family protein [Sphingorhabdus sp.]
MSLPDIYSHPFAPFIAIGLLIFVLVLASRWRVTRILSSIAIWGFMGFLIWSVVQTGGLFDPTLERLASVTGRPAQSVVGEELRVPMAADGHFWVEVSINGTKRRMLVDSGATVTAVPEDTAIAAGLDDKVSPMPVMIRTANGTIAAQSSRVDELRLGNIVARDLGIIVSPALGNTHILGMNFLSRLQSWRVEGRTLILRPHHPQPVKEV